jgi:hypothetical protein
MNLAKPVQADPGTGPADKASNNDPSTKLTDSIICVHRKLDPTKASNMKRIKWVRKSLLLIVV